MQNQTYNRLVQLHCQYELGQAGADHFLFFGGYHPSDPKAGELGRWFNNFRDHACLSMGARLSLWLEN